MMEIITRCVARGIGPDILVFLPILGAPSAVALFSWMQDRVR